MFGRFLVVLDFRRLDGGEQLRGHGGVLSGAHSCAAKMGDGRWEIEAEVAGR